MKKISIIILTAVVALGTTSCTNFLEPTQIDLIYNEAFWETQADAEVGVTGI